MDNHGSLWRKTKNKHQANGFVKQTWNYHKTSSSKKHKKLPSTAVGSAWVAHEWPSPVPTNLHQSGAVSQQPLCKIPGITLRDGAGKEEKGWDGDGTAGGNSRSVVKVQRQRSSDRRHGVFRLVSWLKAYGASVSLVAKRANSTASTCQPLRLAILTHRLATNECLLFPSGFGGGGTGCDGGGGGVCA